MKHSTLTLFTLFFAVFALTINFDVQASSNGLVISQVYAIGGDTGSTYDSDYVEIFNASSSGVSLDGFAVQYAGLPTAPWSVAALPNVTLDAGQYFLLEMDGGTMGGTALPTPDHVLAVNAIGSRGRFALTSSTTPLSGATPLADGDPTIIDFVGYGSTTDSETAAAPSIDGDIAAFRADNGCTDTDDNSADFTTGSPSPRNTSTTKNVCGVGADDPPTVLATSPISDATEVALDASISVTFSEAVTVSIGWYTINCSVSGVHTATVTGDSTIYTLSPTTDFDYNETCTVTITAANVEDQDGDPDNMAADYMWSFMTDSDAPPSVSSTVPTDSAADVARTANISVNFSENVDVTSGWFEIDCTISGMVSAVVTGASGSQNYVFNPDTDFAVGETCTVTIFAANVTDQDGDVDTMLSNHVWSFTIVDNPPIVDRTVPTNSATAAPPDINLLIEFNEPVTVSDNWFSILCSSGIYSATFSGEGAAYVLDPILDFGHDETCTVTVVAANVEDSGGNNLSSDYGFSFTTIAESGAGADVPPTVQEVFPANGAMNVPTDSVITITFSKQVVEVDTSTPLDWVILSCESVGVTSHMIEGGPQAFTVTPDSPLPADDICVVEIIAADLQDIAGDTQDLMTVNHVWSFSTGAGDTTTLPPAIVSVSPGDGAGALANTDIVITFNEDVNVSTGWYTITCTISGAVTASQSGGPQTYTLNPNSDFFNEESCTVTLDASKIVDFDSSPQNLPENYEWTFNIVPAFAECGSAFTPIYDIQGTGDSSPLSGIVITEGVVTGDFEGTTPETLGGFFMQDAAGDANPDTSDGIFVYNPGVHVVTAGDHVRVQGTIEEFNGLTEIKDVIELLVCGPAQPITPTSIALPFSVEPEAFEGMLVTVSNDLMVTGNDDLGQYGNLTLSAGDRLYEPTQRGTPGTEAIAIQNANALNQILLDDGSTALYPDPTPYLNDTVRLGDTVSDLNGVLSYSFGEYRLHPVTAPTIINTNPRTSEPPELLGRLTVATMNLQNYFNGPNYPTPRGADSAEEFSRQRVKVLNALSAINADIFALVEVENDGYDSISALQDIVNGLNTLDPEANYAFIAPDFGLGTDAIKVAIVYKTGVVEPVGDPARTLDPPFDTRRPPLAQTFAEISTGETFTVVVTHFKSRICGSAEGENLDFGQGCWNAERTAAAQTLATWLASDPTGSADSDFLILGDLNAYALEDPLQTLSVNGYSNLIALYEGELAYTHQFEGESGYLDHALASLSLTPQVADLAIWHINADEPRLLDYNVENKSDAQQTMNGGTPYRSSDHDPVIVGLNLDADTPIDTPIYSDSLVLISPTGTITDGYGDPTYEWTRLENATDYQLYIAPEARLTVPILYDIVPEYPTCWADRCTLDPTLTDESTRLLNDTYVVYMRAWFDDTPGGWVGPFRFELNAPPPSTGVNLNMMGTDSTRPIFLWQLDDTAQYSIWYHIVIKRLDQTTDDLPVKPVIDEWIPRREICVEATCVLQRPTDLTVGDYTVELSSWGAGGFSVDTIQDDFTIISEASVNVSGVTVTNNQGRPSIVWKHGEGAVWYLVYVAGEDGKLYQQWHHVAETNCGMTCTFTPDINPTNGTYIAYLMGWGAKGLGNVSGPHEFTLSFPPPEAVLPLAVTDTEDGRPQMMWEGSPGATWYRVWIGTKDFETRFDRWYLAADLGCEQATMCTVNPQSELPNDDLVWFVQAWGPGGFSEWVEGAQFTVNALPAGVPMPIAPVGNVKDRNPVFTWGHLPDAVWYEFTLTGEDGAIHQQWYDFEMLNCTVEGGCTLVMPDLLLEAGTYQWALRSYNPSGVSNYSTPQTFTVLW